VPADGHSTFSSCLLVMDDNHRLAEWLAYHYHVLPLRYMVVGTSILKAHTCELALLFRELYLPLLGGFCSCVTEPKAAFWFVHPRSITY
jgi:hypothetical protein